MTSISFGGSYVATKMADTLSFPITLAIIVPTLNEHDNVGRMVLALEAALGDVRWEAIFVDDGSKDGTANEVEKYARTRPDVRLIRRHNRRGLSSAVIEGALSTTATFIAVIDADMQHDEKLLPAMLQCVADGDADVAIGSRYTDGGGFGDWGQGRRRISRLATWLAELALKQPIKDPMSGFILLRQTTLLGLVPKLSGTGFKILLDILLSSPKLLRVAEFPYQFRNRTAGESKLDSAVALEFVVLLLDKIVGRWIPARLLMFGAVGMLGLVVHLTVLRVVLVQGGEFRLAQALAVCIAIAFNFFLNNATTYRDRRRRGVGGILRGLFSFYLVCGLGALANVGVGSVVYDAQYRWWVAGVAGAAVGVLWNYAASSFFTWRKA